MLWKQPGFKVNQDRPTHMPSSNNTQCTYSCSIINTSLQLWSLTRVYTLFVTQKKCCYSWNLHHVYMYMCTWLNFIGHCEIHHRDWIQGMKLGYKLKITQSQTVIMDPMYMYYRVFSPYTHVHILPLHGRPAGVQQHTVFNWEKVLSPSLWGDAQSYLYKVRIY